MSVEKKGGGLASFKIGQTIISEGAPGKEMFIVEDGQVEILKQAAGEEKQVGVLERGDFFGEMSLIDDLPRAASAKALTDCSLLVVDHSTFDRMLRQYPEVAIRMLRKMSVRLREVEAALEAMESTVAQARHHAAELEHRGAAPVAAPSSPPDTAPGESERPAGAGELHIVLFDTGASIPIGEKQHIRVGRYDSVTNVHPDVDLTEADTYKTTSRRHAKMVKEDGVLYVMEEIGTSNGTFVNGQRIGSGERIAVGDGDWIQFGAVKTILRLG